MKSELLRPTMNAFFSPKIGPAGDTANVSALNDIYIAANAKR